MVMRSPNFYLATPHPEIRSLVDTFLKLRRQDLIDLREALKNSDVSKLRFINHNIRGVALSYGFDGLDVLSREITDSKYDLKEVARIVDEIEHYLNNVSIL